MQHSCYVISHLKLVCHWLSIWLQNCKLGHGRRLRCAFASPNPSAVVANSCTHAPPTPTRRDKTVSSRRRRRCVLGSTVLCVDFNRIESFPRFSGVHYSANQLCRTLHEREYKSRAVAGKRREAVQMSSLDIM